MRFVIITTIVIAFVLTATNAYAQQQGSQQNPYPVYYGWQGPGYYLFTTQNYTTGFVSDLCQLNSINMKLTGNPLQHPFDPNQIGQCLAKTPEFGMLAPIILVTSIIGVLIITKKINYRIR